MTCHVKKLKSKPVVDFVFSVTTADVVLISRTLGCDFPDMRAETLKRPGVAEF